MASQGPVPHAHYLSVDAQKDETDGENVAKAQRHSFPKRVAVVVAVLVTVVLLLVGGVLGVQKMLMGNESNETPTPSSPPEAKVSAPEPKETDKATQQATEQGPLHATQQGGLLHSDNVEEVVESTIGCGLSSGDRTIRVGGKSRKYELYVPSSLAGSTSPPPLVFLWHGIASKPSEIEAKVQLKAEGEKEGWVVVFPVGTGFPKGFNGAGCCFESIIGTGPDEVSFFKAIVTELESQGCADGVNTFSSGFSNGGFMTQRLACEAGTRENGDNWLSAVAVHSGLIGKKFDCAPPKPVPYIHFHATNDAVVGFDGKGPLDTWRSFDEVVSIWKTINGCDEGKFDTYGTSTSACRSYTGCSVEYCTIDGLGHNWSGQPSNAATRPNDIKATEQAVRFFKSNLRT